MIGNYRKYYKKKEWFQIHVAHLKPHIRKLLHPKTMLIWCTLNLKTNRIYIEDGMGIFHRMWDKPNIPLLEKCMGRLFHFLHYKCKIRFRANKKTLQSILISKVAIMMLAKEDSFVYKEAKHKFEILHGVINSANSRQPVFIHDNIGILNPTTTFLDMTGRGNESKELWERWEDLAKCKGKNANIEANAKKFHKLINEKTISMLDVEKIEVNNETSNKKQD